ncbi:hypothetical protein C8R43DRAFT_943926 [Mycena crocata]|nr:hypothetical protein C8R43DRAFT_943926 [Mycena crocata]
MALKRCGDMLAWWVHRRRKYAGSDYGGRNSSNGSFTQFPGNRVQKSRYVAPSFQIITINCGSYAAYFGAVFSARGALRPSANFYLGSFFECTFQSGILQNVLIPVFAAAMRSEKCLGVPISSDVIPRPGTAVRLCALRLIAAPQFLRVSLSPSEKNLPQNVATDVHAPGLVSPDARISCPYPNSPPIRYGGIIRDTSIKATSFTALVTVECSSNVDFTVARLVFGMGCRNSHDDVLASELRFLFLPSSSPLTPLLGLPNTLCFVLATLPGETSLFLPCFFFTQADCLITAPSLCEPAPPYTIHDTRSDHQCLAVCCRASYKSDTGSSVWVGVYAGAQYLLLDSTPMISNTVIPNPPPEPPPSSIPWTRVLAIDSDAAKTPGLGSHSTESNHPQTDPQRFQTRSQLKSTTQIIVNLVSVLRAPLIRSSRCYSPARPLCNAPMILNRSQSQCQSLAQHDIFKLILSSVHPHLYMLLCELNSDPFICTQSNSRTVNRPLSPRCPQPNTANRRSARCPIYPRSDRVWVSINFDQCAFKALPHPHSPRCLHLSSDPRRLQLDLVQTLPAARYTDTLGSPSSSSSRRQSNSESEVFLRCVAVAGRTERVRVQIKRTRSTQLIHIQVNPSFHSERPPPTERIGGACAGAESESKEKNARSKDKEYTEVSCRVARSERGWLDSLREGVG